MDKVVVFYNPPFNFLSHELDVILSHHPARAYLYPTWATGKEEKFRDSLLLGVVF